MSIVARIPRALYRPPAVVYLYGQPCFNFLLYTPAWHCLLRLTWCSRERSRLAQQLCAHFMMQCVVMCYGLQSNVYDNTSKLTVIVAQSTALYTPLGCSCWAHRFIGYMRMIPSYWRDHGIGAARIHYDTGLSLRILAGFQEYSFVPLIHTCVLLNKWWTIGFDSIPCCT